MGLDRLNDDDYPVWTMGQAAELLDVEPAFLRSLDATAVIRPHRSAGGHRRYSRRQLHVAARMRALLDEGLTSSAASRILVLEDELAQARREIAELERRRDGTEPGRRG
ncbi:MerR family transcriptional regulator [Pseudonocardia nigra]|jgi:MerR family transcriptional regulator/heat shock protein HspR|uniref:MerR family transcriptional regulator n=1 Tax=Pseudonocardia nigra TaxID=1921578 RepID=UPI001FE87490|nr:MerR family transcriptional regulator [Pseudonocardia nigra]